ncbi:PH domain-containing protein [Allobaculum mucilyticum]|uniref:PH domain-containing protein n=1 Tax=Allobaculum mucilyticum TaxID=2834459 RepID=UPI001E4E85B8|nr:PH domain-containing protein [Allobaculum mucilyticum]UNT96238.1 PH domain-containing protein [Allobaculum mucilyticum]
MAINFNQDSILTLKPIPSTSVRKDIDGMLISDEEVIMAFATVRDQIIFTNMRIISVDVQGFTGRRKSFTSMPYSRIQYFTIQTPGFAELFSDTELELHFTSGFSARFDFTGRTDIGLLSRVITESIAACRL